MNIRESTQSYERWMGRHTQIVQADLRLKHKLMSASAFQFLRGTFYRWAQIWRKTVPDAAVAPKLLAVGDVHLENFGTWRDGEGRLIWGVNDFDEAYVLPYTIDLVRLATSAYLAIAADHLSLRPRVASEAILEGYRGSIREGGLPFVLGEHHGWLSKIATYRLRDPVEFWKKLMSGPPSRDRVPLGVLREIDKMMPERGLNSIYKHRVAGLGSLGHERMLQIAEYGGAKVVREAKAMIPSACCWAGDTANSPILYEKIRLRAVRVLDPYVRAFDRWLLRRLAPDCSRIEMSSLPAKRDEQRLLYAMGWETANIHLGSERAIVNVKRDLRRREGAWLHRAAKEMVQAVRDDWTEWRGSK
jgi:uncharacterized protein DUF2252